MSRPRYPLLEALGASILMIALIAVLGVLSASAPGGSLIAGTVLPLAFFWLPIGVMIGRGRDFAVYGLTLRDWPRSLRWALLSALIVLPLYAFGHVLWQKHFGHAPHLHLGRALIVVFFRHLLVVALPEELFFRGYVQTLLGQRLHRTAPRWLGERWPAIVATSLLFALAHLAVDGQPARLAVFFPALLFGWLRERTGSLLAPVLVHTLANLTVFILAGSV